MKSNTKTLSISVLDACRADFLYVEDYNDPEKDELQIYEDTALGAMIKGWDEELEDILSNPRYETSTSLPQKSQSRSEGATRTTCARAS